MWTEFTVPHWGDNGTIISGTLKSLPLPEERSVEWCIYTNDGIKAFIVEILCRRCDHYVFGVI
jgi:hypothetical protein